MKANNIIFVLIIGLFSSCGEKETSTLESKDISDKKTRIEKLKAEVTLFSDISDAEFELFNVNGFHGQRIIIPGPTSYSYKIAIKVARKDIAAWTEEFVEVPSNEYDIQFYQFITNTRSKNWITQSQPIRMVRENDDEVSIVIFEKEGIIFKTITHL